MSTTTSTTTSTTRTSTTRTSTTEPVNPACSTAHALVPNPVATSARHLYDADM